MHVFKSNVRDVRYTPWQSLCFFPMVEMAFLQKRRTGSEGGKDTLPYGENLCQVEGSLAYIPELPWASNLPYISLQNLAIESFTPETKSWLGRVTS